MFARFDENHAKFKGRLVDLPSKGVPHGPQEQNPVIAGHGRCRSCDCKGYRPDGPGYCKCGHHYDQHW